MKHLPLLALLGGLLVAGSTSEALAHGGQFKAPGGYVDPGQRAPHDPDPPPPPPPSPPPVTGSDDDAGGGLGGPVTPPPTPRPPVTGGGDLGAPGRGRAPSLSYDQWIFWYAYNSADIENLKEALYSRVGSPSPLSVLGNTGANQGDELHDVRTRVRTDLIPALLWAQDPKNARDPDVESAAYIGLAKITNDPTHIDLLAAGLGKTQSKLVRESSALALGLLRRARTEEQFTGGDLDRVRETLLGVVADTDHETRVRCFAAFAVGLLGDQPSGTPRAPRSVEFSSRLFDLLARTADDHEVPVAVLTAIGLQDARSITEEQREVLRSMVVKRRLGRSTVSPMLCAEAAATLGRIGTERDAGVLRRVLSSRRSDAIVEGSAAIGLGRLAARLDSGERADLASALLTSLRRVKSGQAANFTLISLAYLAIEDIQAGKSEVLEGAKVGAHLLDTATDGQALERPYGALAIALVAREIGESGFVDAHAAFRHKALKALRQGATNARMSPRDQAAFALGLGIAQDHTSVRLLVDMVADPKENLEKKGYAALAVGLATPGTHRDAATVILATLRETRDEELKIRCATALGLLHDREALDVLLNELQGADTQALKGQMALAIAKLGDGRAITPLIEMMKSTKEKDLTRAIVTAALGVIGDMELIPSLTRITDDINYRAMNDSRSEIVSIL